jgi:hypothetical protein
MFTSYYTWGTNGVCKWMQNGCKSLHKFLRSIKWIMFDGHLDYFQKPPLGGTRLDTKPGSHGTLNVHSDLFYFIMWGPTSIEIYWNSIWLSARPHMTSHYIWGSATTLCDFGSVLEWPLDTFFLALTISWTRPLVCVSTGPEGDQSIPDHHIIYIHNLCQPILLQHNIKLW